VALEKAARLDRRNLFPVEMINVGNDLGYGREVNVRRRTEKIGEAEPHPGIAGFRIGADPGVSRISP
jgi:hypothetical protein